MTQKAIFSRCIRYKKYTLFQVSSKAEHCVLWRKRSSWSFQQITADSFAVNPFDAAWLDSELLTYSFMLSQMTVQGITQSPIANVYLIDPGKGFWENWVQARQNATQLGNLVSFESLKSNGGVNTDSNNVGLYTACRSKPMISAFNFCYSEVSMLFPQMIRMQPCGSVCCLPSKPFHCKDQKDTASKSCLDILIPGQYAGRQIWAGQCLFRCWVLRHKWDRRSYLEWYSGHQTAWHKQAQCRGSCLFQHPWWQLLHERVWSLLSLWWPDRSSI